MEASTIESTTERSGSFCCADAEGVESTTKHANSNASFFGEGVMRRSMTRMYNRDTEDDQVTAGRGAISANPLGAPPLYACAEEFQPRRGDIIEPEASPGVRSRTQFSPKGQRKSRFVD